MMVTKVLCLSRTFSECCLTKFASFTVVSHHIGVIFSYKMKCNLILLHLETKTVKVEIVLEGCGFLLGTVTQ